ncbi:TetR family transcriptional regulator (plasmid) [Streptomyces sp. NBC_01724]|uniref:ScbR family autoregulator-binding transcription factor n=1 Tax=Streptomyces sp. NBC_01724 TaxID=2975922 RepID=UPI002E34B014|nr:ScbR family autoregulator-binding transcription factor [Streptomyces sp. NBC_01724]
MTDATNTSGRRSPRQQRAVETRAAIVRAAAEMFQEFGYAATTLDMITKSAGETKGALYYYFHSKKDLAKEILGQQVPLVEILPRQSTKIQEAIDVTFFFAHLLQVDPLARGGVRLSIDLGLPDEIDGLAPFRAWIEYAEMLLGQARDEGHMLPTADAAEVAQTMIGAFTGIQLTSELFDKRQLLPHRIHVLWKLVLPGIALPGLMPGLDYAPDRMARIKFPEAMQTGAP